MAKIDIYFDPETGDIKVEVDGAGGDCVELTKGLEKLLGIQADAKRNLKPEFYEGGRVRSAQSPCDAVDLITAF